jgi:DNA-directed RNA polymerase specialized sigma24 family protein
MPSVREIRALLLELSRRHSRVAHEVEDLAHDVIVSALRRGAALDGDGFLRMAGGAARRHGAFLARTAGRRRAREASATVVQVQGESQDVVGAAPLSALSPALRTTLHLMLLGLEKGELRAALGLSDAALRKRFQALRAHAPLVRPALTLPVRTPVMLQVRRSQIALLPRLALPRVVATTDPDGHGIIFADALTAGRRTATG